MFLRRFYISSRNKKILSLGSIVIVILATITFGLLYSHYHTLFSPSKALRDTPNSNSTAASGNRVQPLVHLSAASTSISNGGSTTLAWSSSNVTSCNASGGWTGLKPATGTQTTGKLTATTVFSLTCSGAYGSVSDTVTVMVASTTAVKTSSTSTTTSTTTSSTPTVATSTGGSSGTPYTNYRSLNTRGIHLISYGDVNISGWSNLNQYGFIFENVPMLATDTGSYMQSMGVAVQQPGTAIEYVDPWSVNSSYNQSVDYTQAVNNNWLARASDNSLIGTYGNPATSQAMTLVDNSAYQQQFIANAEATAANFPGLKGFMLDNILPNYSSELTNYPYGTYAATAYPDETTWRNAILNFVKNVGGALRAKGFYVIANMTGYTQDSGYNEGTFYQSWLQQIAQTGGVDGIMLETWMQDANNLTNMRNNSPGTNGYYGWFSNWIELTTVANQNNVQFFPNEQGTGTNTQAMEYSKAAFMLNWDGIHGGASYAISPAYTGPDPWNAAWTTDIGTPTAAKVLVNSAGVWTRTFTGGWIAVNATLSTQTVTMNGVNYTINPTDAIIHAGT